MGALKAGNFEIGANASAVALKAGAAAATQFDNGVAIFVHPKGGLMAEASVSGQKIKFEPVGSNMKTSSKTERRTYYKD